MPDPAARLRADLRAALAEAGVSQAAASRAMGVTPKHMSHLLSGRTGLSLARADQIARVCGRSLDIRLTPRKDPPTCHTTPLAPVAAMANWTRRERTTTHVEYVLTLPTNWAEVGKIYTALNHELGQAADADNAVEVISDGDELVFRYRKERVHG